MNKLKTCECGEPTYGNKCSLCASEQGLFKAQEQSEIDELRAALQERDAEIERLNGSLILQTDVAIQHGITIAAQRKVLDQALEALEYMLPDTPDQRMKKDAAITAIQEQLA